MKVLEVAHIVRTLEEAELCFDCGPKAVGLLLDLFGRPASFARFDWPARDRYTKRWEGLS